MTYTARPMLRLAALQNRRVGKYQSVTTLWFVSIVEQQSQYIYAIFSLYNIEAGAKRSRLPKSECCSPSPMTACLSGSFQNDAPKDMPLKCVMQTTHVKDIALDFSSVHCVLWSKHSKERLN